METPNPAEPSISVGDLLRDAPSSLKLSLVAGENGLEGRRVSSARIQKLGLAFAGFPDYVHSGRIQMIGSSEAAFLDRMDAAGVADAIRNVDWESISCVVVTKGLVPHEAVVKTANLNSAPVLATPVVSSQAIGLLTGYLQERLAPRVTIHGVLVEMHGLGVLITGESGIGKSECALDLVARGHRLVSDDAVTITRSGGRLVGSSPELTFEHLEIRGLGIVNIRELFGISSVCPSTGIDLCFEMRRWDDTDPGNRGSLERDVENILGVPCSKFTLPVRPGRNLATLVETAVKISLLPDQGRTAAERLFKKHDDAVSGKHAVGK